MLHAFQNKNAGRPFGARHRYHPARRPGRPPPCWAQPDRDPASGARLPASSPAPGSMSGATGAHSPATAGPGSLHVVCRRIPGSRQEVRHDDRVASWVSHLRGDTLKALCKGQRDGTIIVACAGEDHRVVR